MVTLILLILSADVDSSRQLASKKKPSKAYAQCFIVRGVPKSGTTWLTSLLEEMRKLNCREVEEAKRSNTCNNRCVKIQARKHKADVSDALISEARPIFIFRDTRDVLVSHFHWAPHNHTDIAEFARDLKYGVWHIVREQNVMLSVVSSLKSKGLPYYLMFYEKLSANTIYEAKKLAAYAGMKLSIDAIQIAVNRSSFETMRYLEKTGALSLKIHPNSAGILRAADESSIDPSKLFGVMTRKGVAGGWRDELGGGELSLVEKIMRNRLNRELLKRYIQ